MLEERRLKLAELSRQLSIDGGRAMEMKGTAPWVNRIEIQNMEASHARTHIHTHIYAKLNDRHEANIQ